MLQNVSYLVDVVEVGSLVRPVVVALLHSALDQRRQHDDDHAAVLPNHLQREARPCETRPRGRSKASISNPSHVGVREHPVQRNDFVLMEKPEAL